MKGGADPVGAVDKDLEAKEVDLAEKEEEGKKDSDLKILLLGTGDSGKSTILRQLKALYGDGFTTEQRKDFKSAIDSNILASIKALVKKTDPKFWATASASVLASKRFLEEVGEDLKIDEEVGRHVSILWNEPEIRRTLTEVQHTNCLPAEAAVYFLERVEVIGTPGYIPSFRDVLMARASTTGLVRLQCTFGKRKCVFLDTGGERSERKKWKKSFADVTAVIYIVSLSEYDQALFEESEVNRMTESLNLFGEICASPRFRDNPIILLFNKSDVFAEKIKRMNLKCCFPEYDGGSDYDVASKFLQSKFEEKAKGRSRDIHIYTTIGYDSDNVKAVFEKIQEVVIKDL